MLRRPHRVVLAVGLLAIAAHAFVVPERWYEASYDGVELFVLVATIWGIRRHRPQPARPWWLLASGLGLLVVGDVIYNALTRMNGHEVYPSVADALYVASYGVLSAGVIAVLRARRHQRDRTALIDACLVTLVAAAATWVYLVDPTAYSGVRLVEQLVSAAYPVGDLLLLGFLARLLISPSRRPPAEGILAVGLGLLLVADIAYARLALTGTYSVGSWLDAMYHFSYLCFAVAATHPSMRRLSAPEPDYATSGRSRLWLLAGVSLVLPVFATVEAANGDQAHAITLAAASAVAFFLLTFRTGVLNQSLAGALAREKEALDRERVLRALGTALAARPDRAAIWAAAVEHAGHLAGGDAEAVFLAGHTIPEQTPPSGLGPSISAQLQAGRAVAIGRGTADPLRACLPTAMADRALFVAPVVVDGQMDGVIMLAPATTTGNPERLLDACAALGTAVSLALESSALSEALVEQRSEERFSALIRNSSDILLVLQPDGTMRFVSPSATRILGWEVDELLHRPIGNLAHPDDAPLLAAALHRALIEPGTHGPIECRARHKDGSWRFLEAIGTSLLDDGAEAGIVVNVRDVTDRLNLQQQLTHQAFHDPLTGLANRALFLDRVEHTLEGASRTAAMTEILFLDLDDFKTVNDSLGHPAGDAVLVGVAERLRACLRATDTAARLGGDEFAVLLASGDEPCGVVAERIVAELRRPVEVDGHEVAIRGSIGVASGTAGTTAADLLRDADLAMYVAKSAGKDRWVAFQPEMLEQFLDELKLEKALRAAVANDQLEVHYQPIIELATGDITGAEALLRWVDPARGYVAPTEFIHLAERSELIEIIGRFVLRRACHAAATWRLGDGREISHIAVNVSARQLRGESLVNDVTSALHDSGLAPHKLVIEITESMLLEDLPGTIERLDALHALGVRIAIDDFGTGYSSLSRLGQLPVDVLKVDRSFTMALDEAGARTLVPAILELARTLGLATVAEGVETAEQGLRLIGLGCDLAQGFYFARPVPEAELADMLQRPPATALSWIGVQLASGR